MTSVLFRQKKGVIQPTIHFDNEFSARCTILEILAQDAFGLLYRIGSIDFVTRLQYRSGADYDGRAAGD